MTSKISKAQQACVNRYIDKAYDRINLTLPKGMKAVYKAAADRNGESLNAYINRLLEQEQEKASE